MENTYLINLPTEILYRIFDYCDIETILLKLRRVCKRLRTIVYQYNRFHVEFNERNIMYVRHLLHIVPNHSIVSLNMQLMKRWYEIFNDLVHKYKSRFTRLRYLRIPEVKDEHWKNLFTNENSIELISLKIDFIDTPNSAVFSKLSSMLTKLNVQKLYCRMLEYKAKNMSWPIPCKLTYLKLRRCLYSEYLLLLLQLPCLKILELEECIMKTENTCTPSSNISFISQLTCLIITDCSVPIEYLRSLILETPKLRHLKLCYRKEIFKSVVDIYDWEKFIRTELNFLDTCDFLVYYKIPPNDKTNLQLILAPFLESFWVNEKRWFIGCEYVLGHSTILLYTISTNFNFYSYKDVCYAISAKNNNYHLIQRLHNDILTDTLITLDISHGYVHEEDVQYLVPVLENNHPIVKMYLNRNWIKKVSVQRIIDALQYNTTVTTVNLQEFNIKEEEAYHIAHMLETNKGLKIISLESNAIGDNGARDLALALRNNKTLTTLDLARNKIGILGAEYFFESLQSSPVKVSLEENRDFCHLVEPVSRIKNDQSLTKFSLNKIHLKAVTAKYIADALQKNTTIKELDLSYNCIGTKEIIHFANILRENTMLITLNLNNNWLNAVSLQYLVQALKHNTTLHTLNLSYNYIGCDGVEYVTELLKTNKTLTTLDISNNQIEKTDIQSLCILLQKNLTISEIFCNGNPTSPQNTRCIYDLLCANTTLKTLHLGANHSDKPEIRILVDGLECNTTIETLNYKPFRKRRTYYAKVIESQTHRELITLEMGWAPIAETTIDSFFSTIANHPTLTTLNMRQNLTSIDDLDHFGDILRNNMRLTTLCSEKNVIGNHGAENLASGLRDNMTLKTLILSSARIGVAGAKSLADAIQNNTTLTTFVLKHDQIGVQGTEYLANMLKINKTLVDIDLTNNQISDDGAQLMADVLVQNETLSKLNLCTNNIGVRGAKSIANALQNNTTLTVLDLSRNRILSEGAHYLDNALEMNKTLKEMYVSFNQIEDDGVEYLRVSLEKNITLTELHIGSNGITDTMYKEKL
ncbi:unnamed protein product [Rotaria socialis]|uniref:F-box domain-containing protein n=1 Tax=Rotaria socialis TaxID=392032 RepID=A0A818MDS7_9BILA|nr:unnamed protein product [Rotaria socialis]